MFVIFCQKLNGTLLSVIKFTLFKGLDLYKRLPCGIDEQLRYDITAFLAGSETL